MKYIINSEFVSFASSMNIAILASMFITTTLLPDAWILHGTTGLCGVLLNCYVLLHSKRKLGYITEASKKFQHSIEGIKEILKEFKVNAANFINITLKNGVLELLYQQHGIKFLMSYLQLTKKYLSSKPTLLANNKAVKDCTPDLTTSQLIKPVKVKAQSDPLSRTKVSIKQKYLPAASPELFKNKIYLTRRNLTNQLHD